jgi:hypothetical protein
MRDLSAVGIGKAFDCQPRKNFIGGGFSDIGTLTFAVLAVQLRLPLTAAAGLVYESSRAEFAASSHLLLGRQGLGRNGKVADQALATLHGLSQGGFLHPGSDDGDDSVGPVDIGKFVPVSREMGDGGEKVKSHGGRILVHKIGLLPLISIGGLSDYRGFSASLTFSNLDLRCGASNRNPRATIITSACGGI